MRSLTVRIFLSFWLIIALLIGVAAIAGYTYSERIREAFENFEVDDTALAASDALREGGREGLRTWLRDLPASSPIDVYIVDRNRKELLGRNLPYHVRRMIERVDSRRRGPRDGRSRGRNDSPSVRLARPLTQIVGPDGDTYNLVVNAKRNPYGEWLAERAGPAFLLVALLISAAVSFALARAIARPVQTFREATVSIANGELSTRVAESMRNRRDEIGMLAHDLDAMADKLQDASVQQTELTRNISHELRSPLARLRVALELARRRAGDLDEFARIDRESERLDALIGQILSYSRIDAADAESRQRFELHTVLAEAVDNAGYEGGAKNIQVGLSGDTSATLNGYPTALSSAFENILRNAIRHCPDDGNVQVNSEQHNSEITIKICDSGGGVPEESLGKIFEPFFRAPRPEGVNAAGTGLGLAIAERAVRKHGGHIAAKNSPDAGLEIAITLPLNDERR